MPAGILPSSVRTSTCGCPEIKGPFRAPLKGIQGVIQGHILHKYISITLYMYILVYKSQIQDFPSTGPVGSPSHEGYRILRSILGPPMCGNIHLQASVQVLFIALKSFAHMAPLYIYIMYILTCIYTDKHVYM